MDAHIIVAGQSNALGFGNTGPAPYTPTVRVQIWALQPDGSHAWNYMNPGVNTGTANNPTVWGPEVQIANEWLADNASGYLWIVKSAKGSSALAQEVGLDWSHLSSGELFDLTETAVDAARANLTGSPYAFASWDALMWMQGEDDALVAAQAAAYQTNLHDFAAAARVDWNVGTVVVGRISDSPSLPHSLDVRVGQWAEDQADAAMVSFKTIGFGMQADGVHYDATGQLQLGAAFYEAWV